MLGSVKKYTSSYHPQTNGMVERLNHTLYRMLSFLVADDQNNLGEMLRHAVSAHNNNVSKGTELAPNEIHIGRYPRLPMIILEGSDAKTHQSEKRGQLDFLELMRDRLIRAYNLVQEEDRLLKAKHEAANEEIEAAMSNKSKFKQETGRGYTMTPALSREAGNMFSNQTRVARPRNPWH